MNSSKRQPLSPFIRNMNNSSKNSPTIHLFFEALHKVLFESKFSSYCQLSSVEFPLASFLSVPDENGSGSLHENFWFGFVRDLLPRWTSSGTASGSVWNGSISSRVNVRPIRTVLVRFHTEPFPCKRGLKKPFSVYVSRVRFICVQNCCVFPCGLADGWGNT